MQPCVELNRRDLCRFERLLRAGNVPARTQPTPQADALRLDSLCIIVSEQLYEPGLLGIEDCFVFSEEKYGEGFKARHVPGNR